jgi:hypothetical protein
MDFSATTPAWLTVIESRLYNRPCQIAKFSMPL